MTTNRFALFMLACLLIAGIMPGCTSTGGLLGTGLFATSPVTQPSLSAQQSAARDLTVVSTGYTLLLQGLIFAEDTGAISQAQFVSTLPYRNALSSAIAAANTAILNNESTASTLVSAAQAAYASLQNHPVVKASATTKPTT
jgi:hypothetical protein